MELGDGFTIEQLPAVGNSALLTPWARAIEARSADPILVDPKMSCITDLAEIGHAIATGQSRPDDGREPKKADWLTPAFVLQ